MPALFMAKFRLGGPRTTDSMLLFREIAFKEFLFGNFPLKILKLSAQSAAALRLRRPDPYVVRYMEVVFESEQRLLGENARLLSDQSLASLRKYKYNGVDRSLLSRFVLNPFWTRCAALMPPWLAPNVITLIGISAIVLCNLIVLVLQGGDMSTPMPRAVYALIGLSFFFYQTMDNIDGKQARRTGTSSPLGELFDHGIDSLNCLWGALLMITTCGQGSSWTALISLIAPMVGMYLSAWETFYTKTLFLDYLNAPNEGLVVAMVFHFGAVLCGPEFWQLPLGAPGSTLYRFHRGDIWTWALLSTVLLMHIPSCIANVYRHEPETSGANPGFRRQIGNLWPMAAIVAAMLVWCAAPGGVILGSPQKGHLFLFGWCLAFTFGRVSTTIILSHLCYSPKFPHISIPVVLLFGGAVFYGILPRLGVAWGVVGELGYLRAYFVLSALYFFGFANLVIDRITTYLGIRAFTIPHELRTH